MKNWQEVVDFALSLPDVAMAPFYGTPCPKVNGKAFVSPGREPGSFHVMSPHDEKAILLETDPDTFCRRRISPTGPACSCASIRPIPSGYGT